VVGVQLAVMLIAVVASASILIASVVAPENRIPVVHAPMVRAVVIVPEKTKGDAIVPAKLMPVVNTSVIFIAVVPGPVKVRAVTRSTCCLIMLAPSLLNLYFAILATSNLEAMTGGKTRHQPYYSRYEKCFLVVTRAFVVRPVFDKDKNRFLLHFLNLVCYRFFSCFRLCTFCLFSHDILLNGGIAPPTFLSSRNY